MSMGFRYVILGAGRQGTAAAYDLALFGGAASVILADRDPSVARTAAARVNRLADRPVASPTALEVEDLEALRGVLTGADVVLSAVPYRHNLALARAAIAARVRFCDMGGHTETVRGELALDAEARRAGVSLVPDCGMGPGLIVTLGVYAMGYLEEAHELHLYDGGLPQHPVPPWNYALTFHVNGLTNEMDGQACFLRDGRVTPVDSLSEPEFLDFPGLGRLEAAVCSGGLSTAPWTFEGRLRRLENKVLRYPGHFDWLRAFKALGLFSETAIRVHDQDVVPREVYHALLEPRLRQADTRDVCVIRARAVGRKDGCAAVAVADLVDRYDEVTGFTAMERLTGWHCSVVMLLQARGEVPVGAVAMETLPAEPVMEELGRRGIRYDVRLEALEPTREPREVGTPVLRRS
ncbi:MAG TPA: saccharopine dehydrogenase C-terminal domain-containing protein [Vicinamibacteria bacterium]|nr:saccharopine dehydrogenase C-terminal domain-containing protein [Vicinamibacteria bacterium]